MLTEHMAQDLCERHEKGVLHEHQKALQKYSVMRRQMMSAAVQPKEQVSVEQLESRIIQVSLEFSSSGLVRNLERSEKTHVSI